MKDKYMPFDNTKSKSIQISKDTDNKIIEALTIIDNKYHIKLSGRSTAIDYIVSRWLKENKD